MSQERDGAVEETERDTLYSCDLCGSEQIKAVDVACSISACQICGYVFDNPRPTGRAITAFYSKPTKYNHWLAAEEAGTGFGREGWRR